LTFWSIDMDLLRRTTISFTVCTIFLPLTLTDTIWPTPPYTMFKIVMTPQVFVRLPSMDKSPGQQMFYVRECNIMSVVYYLQATCHMSNNRSTTLRREEGTKNAQVPLVHLLDPCSYAHYFHSPQTSNHLQTI